MANGRVITGFSKPYVARYNNNGGNVTYTDGQILARGVSVELSLDSSEDNTFYADNQAAENAGGAFTKGTVTFTVDGMKEAAKKLVYGIPEAEADGTVNYGDSAVAPYVAAGYIVRYMEDSVVTYVPTILRKTKFNLPGESAETQGENLSWQTTQVVALVMRDDTSNHNWKSVMEAGFATEAEAEAWLKDKLGVAPFNSPTVKAESGSTLMFGTPVSDLQSNISIVGKNITGTLKYLSSGDLVNAWGAGNFIALKFDDIPEGTTVKVGLDPSEGSGLVALDLDRNGAFKVTNKDTQRFAVQVTDGTKTQTDYYNLSGLTVLS